VRFRHQAVVSNGHGGQQGTEIYWFKQSGIVMG
jgi:hypothetical protein